MSPRPKFWPHTWLWDWNFSLIFGLRLEGMASPLSLKPKDLWCILITGNWWHCVASRHCSYIYKLLYSQYLWNETKLKLKLISLFWIINKFLISLYIFPDDLIGMFWFAQCVASFSFSLEKLKWPATLHTPVILTLQASQFFYCCRKKKFLYDKCNISNHSLLNFTICIIFFEDSSIIFVFL